MNTQSDIKNVLSAISAAQEAYDRIPGMENTISTLETNLRHSGETIDILNNKISHQSDEIYDLNNTVSTLKGELDEARFQGLLFEEKFTKLQELVKSLAGIVDPPKPEPTPEPVVQPVPDVPAVAETAVQNLGRVEDAVAPIAEEPWWNKPTPAPSDGHSPNAFLNMGYWNKPYSMTDARWAELGGNPKPSNW
jgi:uncharacterized coiled-coil protein SlyX